MRLQRAFYRLPLCFDRERLQLEVERLMATPWLSHPTGYGGNTFLPLVSVIGGGNDDFAISGPMQSTAALESSEYVRQVLEAFNTPIARCRLMRLDPGAEVPWHDDRNFHWYRRLRIHVPIFTEPGVSFECGDQTVHMAAGEAWTFDNFRRHRVTHAGRSPRIHLVADTRITPSARHLLDTSGSPPRLCSHVPGLEVAPQIEAYEFEVLCPDEFHALLSELERDANELGLSPAADMAMKAAVQRVDREYRLAFEQHGRDPSAEWEYHRIISAFRRAMSSCMEALHPISDAMAVIGSMFRTTNRRPGTHGAHRERAAGGLLGRRGAGPDPSLVRASWFAVERSGQHLDISPRGAQGIIARLPAQLEPLLDAFTSPCTEAQLRQRLPDQDPQSLRRKLGLLQSLDLLTVSGAESLRMERPLILLSAPRAGSTLLFELLSQLPGAYTLHGESHSVIEGLAPLHPRHRGYASNVLTADDATEWLSHVLRMRFAERLTDRDGSPATGQAPGAIRMIEKTPKNGLRVGFLNRVFPDAQFLFLHREANASMGSLIEGWRSGQFVTYPKLPGWRGMPWSFLLTPNWKRLSPDSLAAIAAEQWAISNEFILDGLEALPRQRWLALDFDELTRSPRATLERICNWADLPGDDRFVRAFAGSLPLSSSTLSLPSPDKWRRYEADIEAVSSRVEATSQRLRRLRAVQA